MPYGLKVISDINNCTYKILGASQQEILIQDNLNGWYSIGNFKPILRPLADLTKEIELCGETFVPIVKLYIESSEYHNSKVLDYEFIDSWGAKGNILKVYKNRDKDEYTEFVYSNLSFRKDSRYNQGSYNFGMELPHPIRVDDKIHNIFILQQFLFKWHFDIHGLIEQNLAIDINTL